MLRRMFGPKRDEVTRQWTKLHSGELHNLHSSPNIMLSSNNGECGGRGMWHAWEMTGKCTRFGGKARKKVRLKDRGVDGE
jgi:hypothetical protein